MDVGDGLYGAQDVGIFAQEMFPLGDVVDALAEILPQHRRDVDRRDAAGAHFLEDRAAPKRSLKAIDDDGAIVQRLRLGRNNRRIGAHQAVSSRFAAASARWTKSSRSWPQNNSSPTT